MVASAPCPSPRQLVAPLLVRGHVYSYPRVGCQYRGVYRKRNRWRATVKLTWRGGGESRRVMHHVPGPDGRKVFDSPLDAALALATFWRHWLGPDWGHVIANYRRNVWRHAPWRARHVVRRDGLRTQAGWSLVVWADGEPHRVGMPGDGGDREPDGPFAGEPRLFPTWEAARAAIHPWLARTFGPAGVDRMTFGAAGVERMWRPRPQVPPRPVTLG